MESICIERRSDFVECSIEEREEKRYYYLGMLSTYGDSIRVLFDVEVSYSFISSDLID